MELGELEGPEPERGKRVGIGVTENVGEETNDLMEGDGFHPYLDGGKGELDQVDKKEQAGTSGRRHRRRRARQRQRRARETQRLVLVPLWR